MSGVFRIRVLRAAMLALLAALLLSACSHSGKKPDFTPVKLISAEAESDNGFGMGGTGRAADSWSSLAWKQPQRHSLPLEKGFGGTGHSSSGFGGTGIIGTLEDFGSIWVNGIEIGLGDATRIHSNLPGNQAILNASDLRIGQQVWLETHPDSERTTTADIHVYYPLGGKVESVVQLEHAYEMVIDGQRIYVDRDTNVLLDEGLKAGIYVRISGFPVFASGEPRSRNTWRATLIEKLEKPKQWFQPQPKARFSEQVTRVVMQPNWLRSYQLGEFTELQPGLPQHGTVLINRSVASEAVLTAKPLSSAVFEPLQRLEETLTLGGGQ